MADAPDSTAPIWKEPRTRYHYLYARERAARQEGFASGFREAVALLKSLAGNAYADGHDKLARTCRQAATALAEKRPEPEERPPASVMDDAFRVLLADDTPARPFLPKIVCLCGSTKFKDAFIQANFELTMQGCIVLSVGWFGHADRDVYDPSDTEKEALDELHKRKIDLADEVYIINPGGYVSDSTRSEIEYAERLERPVSYLVEPDDDERFEIPGRISHGRQE